MFNRSTDSQLKLWNISKPHCLRTFKGHINEKNFVGLASNGDYVACGKSASEFKNLRWLLQRRRHFKIELCMLVTLCELSFRLVGRNDFHVKAENERLTDGGFALSSEAQIGKFHVVIWQSPPKEVRHVQHDYFSSSNESYH